MKLVHGEGVARGFVCLGENKANMLPSQAVALRTCTVGFTGPVLGSALSEVTAGR